MDHLCEASVNSLEGQLVRHLRERFPLRSTAVGPPSVLRVVQKGIRSARLHGIAAEKDICRLIELMFALGEGLDAKPDLAWVTDVLDRATPNNISARLVQLRGLASERLSGTLDAGPDLALQREAANAIARGRSSTSEERFGDQAAGSPVKPCPFAKRMCSFSS